jgi:hypothetical protein
MNAPGGDARGVRAVAIMGIVAAVLLIGASLVAYRLFVQAPADLARATADGIRSIFQVTPQVSINQTIIIEQASPILEIATVSRQMLIDHQWSHSWLGSTKTIHVRGTFTAKAGYNLKEPFTITIAHDPVRVIARLPVPRLLSVQMDSFVVVTDESGWWNRLTEEDRSQAVATLQSLARSKAESSGILEDVRRSSEDRIREFVERNGNEVIFERPGTPQ